MTEQRIAKAIAHAGLCSRREAERWIEAGRVTVNGEVITSPALTVCEKDAITVDGNVLKAKPTTRLFCYYKPEGLVTTHNDPQKRPTVFDNLPKALPRVISIGRLDLNTEGLLLLTTDGELAERLAHPTLGWKRIYRVRVYGEITQKQLDGLKQGLTIPDPKTGEDVTYRSIEARLEKSSEGRNQWLSMSITEGKNREIRNICRHLGLQVNRLIRTNYGPFTIGNMQAGEVREVAPEVVSRYVTPE